MRMFILTFATAAAVGFAVTPLVRLLALRLGAVSSPKEDRWHRKTVPLLGGAAIWVAVAVTSAIAVSRGGPVFLPALLAGTAMFMVGIIDDFVQLKPSTKLIAQIVTACGVLIVAPPDGWLGLPAVDILLGILWVVCITNAFNLLDNMDGLCAGIAVIAATSLAVSVGGAQPGVTAACAAIAGAAASFLVFNFNPASIFMGDGGSLFLGSTLAVLAMVGAPRAHAGVVSAMAAPVVLMLLPIFDTAFVTFSRKLSARAASVGGRDHTSHRLVALGFSERQAVILCYGLAASAGFASVLLVRPDLYEGRGVAALIVIAFGLLAVQLARVKVYGDADYRVLRNARYTPLLLNVTYKRRIFEVFLDLWLLTIAYYLAYVIRFDREFPIHQGLFLRSLPIVIAAQMASFFIVGVYRGVWRYFTLPDLSTYVKGVALGTLSSVLLLVYLYRFEGFSRGVFIINAMTAGLLITGSRLSFRLMGDVASRYRPATQRALIYGAGDGGALVVRELRNNQRYDCRAAGFLDDDPSKQGRRIMGVPVLGTVEDLDRLIVQKRPDMLIISTDKMPTTQLARIRRVCFESGTQLVQLKFNLDPLLPAPERRL